jgi:glutamate formiminotransferase/formiminotetrahydrofolate cyclodeaminase
MEVSFASLDVIRAMATGGNPNSVSDAGVGALCARAGVLGAFLNVRINAGGYDDKNFVTEIIAKGKDIEERTIRAEAEILRIVQEKIGL